MDSPLSLGQALGLAVLQGITEFLPVSSSGHLVLARRLLGWSDAGGLLFDTLLHAGSLAAILVYFWQDWRTLVRSYLNPADPAAAGYRKLPWLLVVATAPVVVAGPLLKPFLESSALARTAGVAGLSMLMTALFFWLCEQRLKPTGQPLGFGQALWIGCLQVIALLPGASRSGWTTGAGMLAGQTRETAVRFAFLMAIPAIAGAIVFEAPELIRLPPQVINPEVLVVGSVVSFIVSLGAIHFCLRYFRTHSLRVCAVYLAVVGLVALVLR